MQDVHSNQDIDIYTSRKVRRTRTTSKVFFLLRLVFHARLKMLLFIISRKKGWFYSRSETSLYERFQFITFLFNLPLRLRVHWQLGLVYWYYTLNLSQSRYGRSNNAYGLHRQLSCSFVFKIAERNHLFALTLFLY